MNQAVLMAVLPILGAFLLPIVHRYSAVAGRLWGPLILLFNLFLGIRLWQQVAAHGPGAEGIGGFAAPLGIVFYADALAVVFALALTLAGLWLWPRRPHDRDREWGLALLLVGGGCGLAFSGDLFNIFVFYELVAVASYGLAASGRTGGGFAASVRFLILSALGSSLALLGIALIYGATGTLNLAHLSTLAPELLNGPLGLAAFALILIGFGVKAELFPVNTWVPEVYAYAPVRVSGLLAGIVSKLALLAILRILLLLFSGTQAPYLLLALGALGVVSGELAAFRAKELRRMLAYSSIGQLGLVALAFSVSSPLGIAAGIALALHHLVVKPALFLLAGPWGGPLSRLEGGAQASPWGALLFALLALSLIGIPPLPGFWAKFLLIAALVQAGGAVYWSAMLLVMAATVIEAAYLINVLRRLYHREKPQVEAIPGADLAPSLALGTVLLVAMVIVAPLGAGIQWMAQQSADASVYVKAVLGGGP